MTERLIRVVAPHFVAGLVMVGGHCALAAPILRWALGKDAGELRAYFQRKGWRASVVRDVPDGATAPPGNATAAPGTSAQAEPPR
jgi:hypothetical protein